MKRRTNRKRRRKENIEIKMKRPRERHKADTKRRTLVYRHTVTNIKT